MDENKLPVSTEETFSFAAENSAGSVPAGETPPLPAPAAAVPAAVPPSAKPAFGRLGFSLFAIAAVTVVLQLLLGVLLALNSSLLDRPWVSWLFTFAPLYLVGMPLGLLIMRKVPPVRAESSPLGARRFFLMLLMCFPLMYGGNLIGTLLSLLLSNSAAENPLAGFALDSSPVKILFMVVLAPLTEEYVFRRQLIDRTVRYGEKTAILFSALSFGLFHMNLFQFFYAFALGLLFAYIYTRTRRLRYTLALHMIINFLGGVVAPYLLDLFSELPIDEISAGLVDPEELVPMLLPMLGVMLYALALFSLSITGLVMLIARRKQFRLQPAEEELPRGSVFQTVYLRAGYLLFFALCAVVCALSLMG